MQEKEEKRLYPGDAGYKGGTFNTIVYVDGKAKNMKTVKDSNGNVVYVSITEKILGNLQLTSFFLLIHFLSHKSQ